MKKILLGLIAFTSVSAFAADGTVSVNTSTTTENKIDVVINGEAAKAISKQLKSNGVDFLEYPFSNELVQTANGVICIEKNADKPLYCYIGIVGNTVINTNFNR